MEACRVKKAYQIVCAVLLITAFMACDEIDFFEDEDDESSSSNTADTNYNVEVDASNFDNSQPDSNSYMPLSAGTKRSYQAETEDGTEVIVVEVLSETKTVAAGVECIVVRDTVTIDGVLREDTYDWFAIDLQGNVWYMGEEVKNYDSSGNFEDNDGSFEVGVDGALPGIMFFAEPVLEYPFRQEYYKGEAEDWGKVVDLDVTVTLDSAATLADGSTQTTFSNCIKTMEWNPLEEDNVVEYKYNAPGIGVIREEEYEDGKLVETVDLVSLE